jgi:hypothetical protein
MMYYNHKLQKFLKLIYILTHQNVFIWYGIDALNVYMYVHVCTCKHNILQRQVI